jgi:hypothetical protein
MQKVKRKRTGGQLGSYNMRLNWSTKRYCDDFDNVYCDPKRAEKIKFSEANGIIHNAKNAEIIF